MHIYTRSLDLLWVADIIKQLVFKPAFTKMVFSIHTMNIRLEPDACQPFITTIQCLDRVDTLTMPRASSALSEHPLIQCEVRLSPSARIQPLLMKRKEWILKIREVILTSIHWLGFLSLTLW